LLLNFLGDCVRNKIALMLALLAMSCYAQTQQLNPDINSSSVPVDTSNGGMQSTANSGMQNLSSATSAGGSLAGIMTGVSSSNTPTCTGSPWSTCVMMVAGAVGAIAAIAGMISTSSSGAGASQLANQVTSGAATTPTPTTALDPAVVKALSDLAATGTTYNPATGAVTLPNGSTTSAGALTGGDLSGTGLSPADQAAAKTALAGLVQNAKKDLDKALADVNTDLPPPGGDLSLTKPSADVVAVAPVKAARTAASASGAKKVVANGKDAIGVAGDDLFGMIGNRYRTTGDQGGFVAQ
jgi:hypothetical protein